METVVLRIIKLCESAILVGQLRFVERVGGIEPPSPAWKAGVIAFIRYPQAIEYPNKKLQSDPDVLRDSAFVQVFYRS